MKIGLVRRGFSPTGGAEAYLRRFADAARSAGHEIVLFTAEWPQKDWPHEHVFVGGDYPVFFADSLFRLKPQERCDLLFSLERIWTCDIYRAGDGVHAAWLKRRARFEPWWRSWFRRLNPKHGELLGIEKQLFGVQGARAVIANSRMVAREITDGFDYPAEKLHVIHNGVPPTTVDDGQRQRARAELGFGDGDYVLLFAGSGWERKGLRFAIAALERAALPDATLLVAGRGSRRGLPPSQQVRFLGPVTDLPRYLAAANAYILPTIYDPFSNASLEAAAAGLPVITTVANGFSEIIESGVEGSVVAAPDDLDALSAAIQHWSDPDLRSAVRARLQALGARYNIDENVRQTLALIESLRLRKCRSQD